MQLLNFLAFVLPIALVSAIPAGSGITTTTDPAARPSSVPGILFTYSTSSGGAAGNAGATGGAAGGQIGGSFGTGGATGSIGGAYASASGGLAGGVNPTTAAGCAGGAVGTAGFTVCLKGRNAMPLPTPM